MLTPRELATVLAALRLWQQEIIAGGVDPTAFPHFDIHPLLTANEIDLLCERLNCGGDRCDCELPGFYHSGVPGILARMENGRLAAGAGVERCDQCQRYPSDEAALVRIRELGVA